MSIQRRLLPVVTITGSSLVVGCSGGSGGSCGSSGGCPPTNVIGPGYYQGTLTAQAGAPSAPVVAIIAENGDGAISAQDGSYYRLNVGFSATQISGTFVGLSPGTGGTLSSSGSVNAQATSGGGLSGTLTAGSGAADTFQLNFDSVYNMASSLAALAGTWSYTANGFSLTVTIAADGTFTGTDSGNCSYKGAFGIIDPATNAYSETYARSCSGASLTFTGLAAYLPPSNGTNAEIEMMGDDNAGDFLVAALQ
jgi:hypothetical protein